MSSSCVGERFTEIRRSLGIASPSAMSKKLGIGINAWKSYEESQGTPSWSTLEKLLALGFNLGWLMTGAGEMMLADVGRGVLPFDARFMARVAVAVADVYREAGQPVSDAHRAMEEHRILTAILSSAEHPDEYDDQLELEKKRLRRRLAEARLEPGKGKASA